EELGERRHVAGVQADDADLDRLGRGRGGREQEGGGDPGENAVHEGLLQGGGQFPVMRYSALRPRRESRPAAAAGEAIVSSSMMFSASFSNFGAGATTVQRPARFRAYTRPPASSSDALKSPASRSLQCGWPVAASRQLRTPLSAIQNKRPLWYTGLELAGVADLCCHTLL